MDKLVRVSNSVRGKKLITSSLDFEDFLSKVKTKFDLSPDVNISLADDQGAEVDQEVFPILLHQEVIPNITFRVTEESDESSFSQSAVGTPQIFYINSPISSPSPPSPASSSSRYVQDNEYFKQTLDIHIQANPLLLELVSSCNNNGLVDTDASTTLINEFVSKLIELRGDSPATRDQKLLAKAIVQILPCWRYSGSSDGIDILYDEVSRSGLIQTRLRWIHRNLKDKKVAKSQIGRAASTSGGPKPKGRKLDEQSSVATDDKAISELNSTVTEEDIKRLIKQTLEHRNYMRATNDQSILSVYRKFSECGFLINFEFSLMHPQHELNFLQVWPEFAKKLLQNCRNISKSPSLLKFLNDDAGKWDQSTAALFVLLHLIPPTAQGQGKGARCKIDDAKFRLVAYHKSATPLQSIVDTWNSEIKQPALIYLGDDQAEPSTFFLICDRLILPLSAKSSVEAIDLLFKSHYTFGTEYDCNLTGLWKFIQVHIFKLDIESTSLPRKVKQVFVQLSSILEDKSVQI